MHWQKESDSGFLISKLESKPVMNMQVVSEKKAFGFLGWYINSSVLRPERKTHSLRSNLIWFTWISYFLYNQVFVFIAFTRRNSMLYMVDDCIDCQVFVLFLTADRWYLSLYLSRTQTRCIAKIHSYFVILKNILLKHLFTIILTQFLVTLPLFLSFFE